MEISLAAPFCQGQKREFDMLHFVVIFRFLLLDSSFVPIKDPFTALLTHHFAPLFRTSQQVSIETKKAGPLLSASDKTPFRSASAPLKIVRTPFDT